MTRRSGRHFLQLPGPSPVPDRIQRAMHRAVIDHRGPEFRELALSVLAGMKRVFRTEGRVFIYPSSATGAWESAMANTLSAGDRVVFFDHGFFANKWARVAERLGLEVEMVPGEWREGVRPERVHERLKADGGHRIKAVMIVHNETSTGVCTPIQPIREAIDAAGHPALLMTDTVSSLAAIDYRHDAWGVDVSVCGSQKALMLPPGLGFVAAGPKALQAAETADLAAAYWNWDDMIQFNDRGFFPYTPSTTLLFGLREALAMLEDEVLEAVFARHRKYASAVRTAVEHWGLECFAIPREERSNTVTSVLVPPDEDAEELRRLILERFDMSLGKGLGKLEGRVFRIGHLGDTNELTILGALAGVEMGLREAGFSYQPGGVQAAMEKLAAAPVPAGA